jgi:nitrogen fixation/metabolism regulation signal transduction histidine kinase
VTPAAFSFPTGVAIRALVVFGLSTLLAFLLVQTQFYANALLVAAILALSTIELVRYATRVDRDLIRAIQAVGAADLLDRVVVSSQGHARSALAEALNHSIDRLRRRHLEAESERARLQTMVEHVPVALIAVEADGRIGSANRAALRFFAKTPLERRDDLERLAPALTRLLDGAGGRAVVEIDAGGDTRRVLVSVVRMLGARGEVALISLQSIEGELEASELKAWEEVTRVLAHEIMNSLTPVASLAETALQMIADLPPGDAAAGSMPHVAEAIDAIHRRSGGLMRFIDAYRRFAEPPVPIKQRVAVITLLHQAVRLSASFADADTRFDVAAAPDGLLVDSDPDLIEQALINLLRNAVEAVRGREDACVWLSGALSPQGRVVIEIADNGPGIPVSLRQLAFVPFFTTKQSGSGIGLTVVRQIMLAHGGVVELVPSDTGATFRLVF